MDLFIERVWAMSKAWRGMQLPDLLKYDNWNMLGHAACADYLIVGERVNPKFRELYWPFYDYGNSSLHLTQAIHSLELKEHNFLYANAFNHDGSPNWLIDYVMETYNKKIITLGKQAEDAVAHHTIHAALPHPSYAKRFGKVDMVEVMKHAIC